MENCLFCKIVKGEVKSDKVYEDDYVYCFKDINPVAPIHLLVIPKKHINSLADLTNEDQEYIWKIHEAINKVAEKLEFKSDGYRIIVNCGKDARSRSNAPTLPSASRNKLGYKNNLR